jgi:hypothetical protein
MPAPSMPEARNLHREVQALIEQAAVQQAESSASRIRQQGSEQDDGGAQGPEVSVHAGGVTGQPANQGRKPVREPILDTRAGPGRRRSQCHQCPADGQHRDTGGGRLPPTAGWAL